MPDPTPIPALAAELRALLEKATPGTWMYFGTEGGAYEGNIMAVPAGMDSGIHHITSTPEADDRPDDMELICAAVNALPALLDAITALQAEAGRLRSTISRVITEQTDEPQRWCNTCSHEVRQCIEFGWCPVGILRAALHPEGKAE